MLGGFGLFAGHPPLDWSWAGWVALAPVVLLARDVAHDRSWLRAAVGWGLLVGLVFFVPLLPWIGRFGVAPWLLLSTVQAVFVAAFVAVVAAWGDRTGAPVVAAAGWVGLEWARSSFPLNGFPWGVLGYTQHDGGVLLPLARAGGVLGVSLALAVVSVAVAELLTRRGRAPLRAGISVAAVAAVVALGVLVPQTSTERMEPTLDIAGVQGNTVELPPFVDRANTQRVEDIAELMVTATRTLDAAPGQSPDVVVWPENALDADPRRHPELADRIAEAQAAIGDATLLAGTLLDGPQDRTFRNAIVRYTQDGEIAEVYDKRVLVPFGEYVPWRWLFGELPPLRAIPNDAVAGSEAKVFAVEGGIVGPVTCFESIFPRVVRDQVRAGAEVLVVSTNNASFGRTPASRQHLAFSQLRAVETGRWALHAGISGISAIVDPQGGLTQETELFERAVVRDELPLLEATTPYVRTGDLVGPGTALLTAAAIAGAVMRRRRLKSAPAG